MNETFEPGNWARIKIFWRSCGDPGTVCILKVVYLWPKQGSAYWQKTASNMLWLFLGLPILLRQQRPGLHGEPFAIYKFRTMTDARDADGNLLPDSQRLTPFGHFLRSTSLDELPELFNVLKEDMSLVGPRSLLMQYLDRYTPEQTRRHEVKPGITG